MKKKVFYWSPHINCEVATVKAVLNSAYGLKRYNKIFEPTIINAFGEWNEFSNELTSKEINTKKLIDLKKKLPINGYIQSRIFYIYFSILSLLPLYKLIKKEKPDYLIIHLITVPVLILAVFFNFKTKFILRISGYPKLNILRKLFWKLSSKRIFKVFTPTEITKNLLVKKKIFTINQTFLLSDPIITVRKIPQLKNSDIDKDLKNKNFVLSIGRLTKQKNFKFLIDNFSEIKEIFEDTKLVIIGSGEEKEELKKKIQDKNLGKDVILKDYTNNIFNYLKNSKMFVMTSEWEDPGFVLVEAAALNKLILSSDCLSGPVEFVGDSCGILFKKNNKDSFQQKMSYALKNLSTKEIFEKKINAKSKIKPFTIFGHQAKLANLLD